MPPTSLEVLGVLDDEDAISNLLAYGVNSSPGLARALLAALRPDQSGSGDEARAYTRKRVLGRDVPDLLLKVREGSCVRLHLIENKLGAQEGDAQTARYGSKECLRALQARLDPEPPVGEWLPVAHYTYLTLYPWQTPANPQFVHRTYEQLLSDRRLLDHADDPLAHRLLSELSDAYLAFYAAGRLEPGDRVLEKLSARGGLDPAFLYFASLFRGLPYPAGLQVRETGHSSNPGRHYCVAVISKERWRSPRSADSPGFHIHLEPQFDMLGRRFSLFLHYETGEYLPRKQAAQQFGHRLEAYDRRRREFVEHMQRVQLPGLQLGGRSNQVGRLQVRLDGQTRLSEFVQQLRTAMAGVAKAVDGFLGSAAQGDAALEE